VGLPVGWLLRWLSDDQPSMTSAIRLARHRSQWQRERKSDPECEFKLQQHQRQHGARAPVVSQQPPGNGLRPADQQE
jgi:hypothetical protein